LVDGNDADTPDIAEKAGARVLASERSAGTIALLNAFPAGRDGRWSVTVKVDGQANARRVAPARKELSASALLEQKIRNNPVYQTLSAGDKGVAEWIMWRASLAEPDKRTYYLEKLDTLFNTPYSKDRSTLEEKANGKADASLAQEQARGDVFKGQEEQTSAKAHLTLRTGFRGTHYQVDGSDPRSVVVKVKVHVAGEPSAVTRLKQLEDSIEKQASTAGYVVDLEFVDQPGSDVFEVKVDPKRWPVTDNWTGGTEVVAHELHHLLGLRDRYDYIEAHAGNQDIALDQRLYLFARQMMKPPDPRGSASLMGNHTGRPLSEDVCAVLQDPRKECIDARKEFDPPGLSNHEQGLH